MELFFLAVLKVTTLPFFLLNSSTVFFIGLVFYRLPKKIKMIIKNRPKVLKFI